MAPVHLLLMQKRVYQPGWPMTVLKFWFVGWRHFWLLALVLMVATAPGMAHRGRGAAVLHSVTSLSRQAQASCQLCELQLADICRPLNEKDFFS
ncbi:hypothetical protein RHOFW510R12_32150 [Rhodanobacter sp. FW510-R12]